MRRRPHWKTGFVVAAATFGLVVLLAASPRPPQVTQTVTLPVVLTFDANQSKVQYVVDTTLHTVHGTFNVKSGTVQFDPQTGKADGMIVIFATSGESGNSSRDERMHKEILETQKYGEATFRPTQIDGQVSLTAPSDFKVKGIFSLHGGDHDLVADVHSEFSGGQWKGTAKFDVPYISWGIKDPSNFLLKVKPVVHVEMDMAGTHGAAK
jgi:polyisoprenoid-binding protein YceI